MEQNRGAYRPRGIDRAVFGALGGAFIFDGCYIIGPWYPKLARNGDETLLFALFNNSPMVEVYGMLLAIVGFMFVYAASGSQASKPYTYITSGALLSGFLLRLYALIGMTVALDGWRAPTFLNYATVVIIGAYWLWVKYSVRTTK